MAKGGAKKSGGKSADFSIKHGGDRKTDIFHMKRATNHMVKQLGKRLAEKDKG